MPASCLPVHVLFRPASLRSAFPPKPTSCPQAANGCTKSSTMASASLPARLARTSARWSAPWASMATPPAFVTAAAAIPCGTREELASGLSGVLLMQQIIRKANHGALKNPLFRCVIVSVPEFCRWSERTPLGQSCGANFQGGYIMLKILTALAASLAMLSAAAAADLPRREPPPPAPPPVGKWPVGKAPIGKYPPPAPVVTKG